MSAKRYFLYIFYVLLVSLVLHGCGGSGGGSSDEKPTSKSISVSGVAQKGLFQSLNIQVKEFNQQSKTWEPKAEAQFSGSDYTIDVTANTLAVIEAKGTFVNEATGEIDTLSEPIKTTILPSSEPVKSNVNLVTHAVTERFLKKHIELPQNPVQETYSQSEQFVNPVFGFASNFDSKSADITKVAATDTISSPNVNLLLLSTAILEQTKDQLDLGQYVADLVTSVAIADKLESIQPVLGFLNGLNAQSLYEKATNTLGDLPALEWAGEPVVWSCGTAQLCNWGNQDPKTLSINSPTLYEADAKGFVRVSLPISAAVDVSVALAIKGGSATEKKDYTLQMVSATIPSGQSYVDFPIAVVIDNLDEANETIDVELSTSTDGYSVANATAVITIKNGAPTLLPYNANNQVSVDDLCLLDIAPTDYTSRANCSTGSAAIKPVVENGSVAAHIQLKLTDTCNDSACKLPSGGILVELLLQAKDGSNTVTNETPLGQYRYPVSALNQTPDNKLLVALNSSEVAAELIEAEDNNWTTQIVARLPQKSNEQAVADIGSPPPALPSVLTSGDWAFAMVEDSVSIADGTGTCNNGGALITADFESPLNVGENTPSVNKTACISVETKEENGQKTLIASISDGEMDITGLLIPLADNHLVYGISASTSFLGVSLPKEQGLLLNGKLWLHADGMPFGFKIAGGAIKPDGLYLQYEQIDYFMQPEFSASDPRSTKTLASNDVVFSTLKGKSGQFKYTQNGIQTTFSVPAGTAETAYPKGQISWSDFTQTVVDGQLKPATISFTYGLSQFSDCRQFGCNNNPQRRYALTAQNLSITDRGIIHGQAEVELPQGKAIIDHPSWGGIGSDKFAFSRPSDMQNASSVTLSLPGYRFNYDTNAPSVGYFLQGHVFSNDSNSDPILQSYLTEQSKQGNGFPVGFSLGPQNYVDSSGQPEQGGGSLLAGTELEINNGSELNKIKVSNAAKYVIRNSGITGVFNADQSSLEDPYNVSGYPLNLTNFAIRLVDNTLDTYNWIDGNLKIEGYAGLQLHFTNFELSCSAQFNKAILTYEECDDTDNNNNGVVDENCPQRLKAWAAETQVFGLSMIDDGNAQANGLSCSTPDQVLQLDQHIKFSALDKPIKTKALWGNDGKLISSKETLLNQYRLDTTEDDIGFLVQLRNAKLANSTGATQHGWLEATQSDFFVPFWNDVKTDIRLANKLVADDADIKAEPTIVAKMDSLKNLTPDQVNLVNTELYDKDVFEEKSYQIDAKYEWGNTGFGFLLPVYYSPYNPNDEDSDNDDQSRFLGVQQNTDLFVLEANAGIDFIESNRTKLSFGASADFKRLKGIKFQVDLDNPDNLKLVDKALTEANITTQAVIEPALEYPQTLLNKVNRFANRGVDDLLRQHLDKTLKLASDQIGATLPTNEDPFVTTSKILAWLKSLPQQLEILIEDQLQKPVNGIINNGRQSLRSDLLLFKNKIDAINTGDPIPSDVFVILNRIKDTIRFIKAEINGVDRNISTPINQAKSIINQANGYLVQLDESVQQVDALINQVANFSASLCTQPNAADEVKGYLVPYLNNLADIRLFLQFLAGGNTLDPIAAIIAQDTSLQDSMRDTQLELARQAKELLTTVSEIETIVRNEICGASIDEVLAGAKTVTSRIQADRQFIQAKLSLVRNEVIVLENLKNSFKEKIVQPVDQAYAIIDDIETELKKRRDEFQSAKLSDQINAILVASTDSLITVIVVDSTSNATDRDITNVLLDDIQNEFNTTLDLTIHSIRKDIDSAFDVAYYTPEQLRKMLINQIIASNPVNKLRKTSNQYLSEINRKINKMATDLTDQVNTAVKTALAKAEGEINQALADATAPVKNIPLDSASLDGFGIIAGNELERVHIGAEWIMSPAAEGESPTSFNAALDATSWSASNKNAGCSIPAAQSLIDVEISSRNLPATIADTDITIELINLGFTLDQAGGVSGVLPKGVFGGIRAIGDIGFTEFVIYDPAFAAGIGVQETYLGASAGALFSDVQMELAFFAGKSCNQDVLLGLDPDVAKFITLPPNGFAGFYARGAASFPIWTNGCALTVGVGADVGTWLFAGSPSTFGGLVGGRAYGQALCIAALAGKVSALAEITTDGDVSFVGSGFGAAGVGWCEPAGWTTVKRSRDDSYCGTGDVQFSAGYKNGWTLFNIEASAVH